jgi:hypothetical protein
VARRALTVQVTSDGAPVAGASVIAARAPHAESSGFGRTDDHGRAALALPPGVYQVLARHVADDGALQEARDEVLVDDVAAAPLVSLALRRVTSSAGR